MAKKTLRDVDPSGKRLLVRVDFNVPTEEDGTITNDRRIRAALPTIRYALEHRAAVIVMSHLGRPTGDPVADAPFRMDRVAKRLGELLPGVSVHKCDEVIGPAASKAASQLQPGQVLVLENLRFHPGEKSGSADYAAALRGLADIYVNDAFGTCHRKDGSMFAVPEKFPRGNRVVGFVVEKELRILDELLHSPKRPLVAIMGGAKVSDKIGFIEAIIQKVDQLMIGGAMTYTFRKARGETVGSSRVEADKLDLAERLLTLAGPKLVLPVDHLVVERPEPLTRSRIVRGDIPDGWCGVDIGPETIALYAGAIAEAGTVLWNGPLGMFEVPLFAQGTEGIARAMAASKATTIVGGGESAEAVEAFGLADRMTHVSTGGGAFLEYVEGKPFLPLSVIDET